MSLPARWPILGLVVLFITLDGSFARAAPCPLDERSRTLVLALDGVPYRTVKKAQGRGAFAGYQPVRPLVATFPSMTNVGFAAIFAPLGAKPVPGYELPHFDYEQQRIVGPSPLQVKDGGFAWRDHLDQEREGAFVRLRGFSMPRSDARRTLTKVERRVLEGTEDRLVLYIHGTDSLHHFRGSRGTARYLIELDSRLTELEQRHFEQTGRCLRVVLLSDHGNTDKKVRRLEGLEAHLQSAGFRRVNRLEEPGDVVAPVLGVVSFGALFLRREDARRMAAHLVEHPHVDLAMFLSGERQGTVVGAETEAAISWRGTSGRSFRSEPIAGDPLVLGSSLKQIMAATAPNDDGYASAATWLEHTADHRYPDAPKRIVEGLDGTWVANSATVLYSIRPGYANGRFIAHLGAWTKAGKLEGTHGGLDRDSSLGFFMTNDPTYDPERSVRAEQALAELVRRASEGAQPP